MTGRAVGHRGHVDTYKGEEVTFREGARGEAILGGNGDKALLV